MANFSYINKEKSIETGQLISKRDWIDYLDIFSFYFIAGAFMFYGILIEITIKIDGDFTYFLVYILAPFFILLALFCIYRKFNESELLLVETNLSKKQNVDALKLFLKKYNYNIDQESKDIILVIDEHMLSFNGIWRKKYVFIVEDYAIYFNIIKLYPIISPPVLFGHLILKSDLKKFISSYKL